MASAISRTPRASATGLRGRCAARPRICAKVGALVPDAKAAAPITGDANAAPAQASERSQSPIVRLSTGTFANVQPIRKPDTIAIAAIRDHQPLPAASAVRLRTPSAVANTTAASPTPPAACQRQCGWLDTRPPQPNLG